MLFIFILEGFLAYRLFANNFINIFFYKRYRNPYIPINKIVSEAFINDETNYYNVAYTLSP